MWHWFDAAYRTRDGLVCSHHRVLFSAFEAIYADKLYAHSSGCPVCVGMIRAEVRRDIRRHVATWRHQSRNQ